MRCFKVRRHPIWEYGKQWEALFLWEKVVTAEVPAEQEMFMLLSAGKIEEAAALMLEKFIAELLQKKKVVRREVLVSHALRLGLNFQWHGKWLPQKPVHVPIEPRRFG